MGWTQCRQAQDALSLGEFRRILAFSEKAIDGASSPALQCEGRQRRRPGIACNAFVSLILCTYVVVNLAGSDHPGNCGGMVGCTGGGLRSSPNSVLDSFIGEDPYGEEITAASRGMFCNVAQQRFGQV